MIVSLLGHEPSEEDEFPPKLLDQPVFKHVNWPDEFAHAGSSTRFDYSSRIHSEENGEWKEFRHRTSTGIQVYLPFYGELAGSLDDDGALGPSPKQYQFKEPFEPVHMGFALVLYFTAHDGHQIVLAGHGVEIEQDDLERAYRVIEIPPTVFAWDPENLRVIGLSETGDEVRFVLAGGLLRLSDDAMLVG